MLAAVSHVAEAQAQVAVAVGRRTLAELAHQFHHDLNRWFKRAKRICLRTCRGRMKACVGMMIWLVPRYLQALHRNPKRSEPLTLNLAQTSNP